MRIAKASGDGPNMLHLKDFERVIGDIDAYSYSIPRLKAVDLQTRC